MDKYRSLVLPIAILLGFLFHNLCHQGRVLVPFLIFTILLFNFVSVNIRNLRLSMLDFWLLLFQIGVSIGCYYLVLGLGGSTIVAQGLLVGVLCPVAAASVVIACLLGANRETMTTFVIVDNLMVAVVAPLFFSMTEANSELSFWPSFLLILRRVGPVIALPFFVAVFLQSFANKLSLWMRKYTTCTFYIWALTLSITLGQTIHFMFLNGRENLHAILILGSLSLVFCAIQFGLGKYIGSRYGDTIAGGQLLGQKNSSMGIWMANTFLNPIASVFPALYSVWQNLFNSWQLWHYGKKQKQRP